MKRFTDDNINVGESSSDLKRTRIEGDDNIETGDVKKQKNDEEDETVDLFLNKYENVVEEDKLTVVKEISEVLKSGLSSYTQTSNSKAFEGHYCRLKQYLISDVFDEELKAYRGRRSDDVVKYTKEDVAKYDRNFDCCEALDKIGNDYYLYYNSVYTIDIHIHNDYYNSSKTTNLMDIRDFTVNFFDNFENPCKDQTGKFKSRMIFSGVITSTQRKTMQNQQFTSYSFAPSNLKTSSKHSLYRTIGVGVKNPCCIYEYDVKKKSTQKKTTTIPDYLKGGCGVTTLECIIGLSSMYLKPGVLHGVDKIYQAGEVDFLITEVNDG